MDFKLFGNGLVTHARLMDSNNGLRWLLMSCSRLAKSQNFSFYRGDHTGMDDDKLIQIHLIICYLPSW